MNLRRSEVAHSALVDRFPLAGALHVAAGRLNAASELSSARALLDLEREIAEREDVDLWILTVGICPVLDSRIRRGSELEDQLGRSEP